MRNARQTTPRCLRTSHASRLIIALILALPTARAWAADGAIEINHARALQGSISVGDAPGYPVTLNAPGHYILTSDLAVSNPSVDGIEVSSPGVSIDLKGFSLTGPGSCSGSGSTIDCPPIGAGTGVSSTVGVSVTGGTIRGFNGSGVLGGRGSRLIDLYVTENSALGLQTSGEAEIGRNVVARNGSTGISGGEGSNLYRNAVFGNGNTGISGSVGTRIVENSAWRNGAFGISASGSDTNAALVEHNAVVENGGGGILIDDGTLAIGNAVKDNTGNGMAVVLGAAYGLNNLRGNTGVTITVTGGDIDNNVCEGNLTCP